MSCLCCSQAADYYPPCIIISLPAANIAIWCFPNCKIFWLLLEKSLFWSWTVPNCLQISKLNSLWQQKCAYIEQRHEVWPWDSEGDFSCSVSLQHTNFGQNTIFGEQNQLCTGLQTKFPALCKLGWKTQSNCSLGCEQTDTHSWQESPCR